MSGIFGYTHKTDDQRIHEDTLGGLEYWNRNYGREAYASKRTRFSGLGCHVEHFSDAFPYGGPVLEQDGCPAVVDALLYNRDELTAALGLETDSAISDEELLLKLIREKGYDALVMVNGDFAGGILDPETGSWTIFRDHMGVRPLYCYLDDVCAAFSTDMRGLAAIPGADLSIDEMDFYVNIIAHNTLALQRTEFQRIIALKPGAVTRIRPADGGFVLEEQTYWTPGSKKIRLPSDDAYRQEMRCLITDSVNRRCDAIPGILGAELSGGLDSSVIDILIARHGRDARFFSWSWDFSLIPRNEVEDERSVIEEICRRENIECHFLLDSDVIPLAQFGERVIPPYVNTLPLSYASAWLRKQGARVVFTGHGGDEGVSHRGRRYELFHSREYATYFKYFFQDFRGRKLRLVRTVRTGLIEAWCRKKDIRDYMDPKPDHSLLQPDFVQRITTRFQPQEYTFQYDPRLFVRQGGSRNRMDNTAYHGAIHGVRYLFPYVDHRVMDFALGIPRRLFIGRENNRMIFREAFRDLMPTTLFNRVLKRAASTMNIQEKGLEQEAVDTFVADFLAQLNRAEWEEYLDFDKVEARLLTYNGKGGGIGTVRSLIYYLQRCIAMQNVRENSKKWREFDEQDKTV